MIRVSLHGHTHTYPLSDVLRLFFGPSRTVSDHSIETGEGEPLANITSAVTLMEDQLVRVHTTLTLLSGDPAPVSVPERLIEGRLTKREIKRQMYDLLSAWTGIRFPWGSLTGIRPTLVARECLQDNPETAAADLHQVYRVDTNKAELAVRTARLEEEIQNGMDENAVCLYVSIPFCPSRCDYCSFTMAGNQASDDMLERTVDALLEEARRVLPAVSRPVMSVYIGGGTPTVLSDRQLDRLLSGLKAVMNESWDAEWTVEAGRPDSITPDKLAVLQRHGIDRICVNPQSMKDESLERIGRCHTAAQTREAVGQVRAYGFPILNMDLIAGLPGETFEDFSATLQAVLSMNPENITIHTLSMKRKSALTGQMKIQGQAASGIGQLTRPDPMVAKMMDQAHRQLRDAGWRPYYLYRQKDAVGGLENVGYAHPGTECRYNVAMMGDQQSVIGLGCGAMSKKVTGDHVERIPTVRNPVHYLERVQEMADRIVHRFTSTE